MKRTRLAWIAGAVCALVPGVSEAAVRISSTAHVQLVFTSVREIPKAAPAGRTGLKFQTALSGFGFTGGSAADADSDVNVDLGYLGGFPDGNAPLPGQGVYVGFNPYASCSELGDAFGIGALYFQVALTDKTKGASSWEITCEVSTWIMVESTYDGVEASSTRWAGLAGFDVTDSFSAYECIPVQHTGVRPGTSEVRYGPKQVVTLIISGSPDMDPAAAVVNLRAEAEASVKLGGESGTFSQGETFAFDHSWDLHEK